MASMKQEMEIEIGGTKYTARTDIDVAEKIEDATDMGALQILRAAAAPTITTRHLIAILGLTLFRIDPDASVKPKPIGDVGARSLVSKAGYFESTAAVLKIIGMWFKDDAKTEAGDEAA